MAPSSASGRSRQVLRRLVRNWQYSLGIVLVLAMGIGPATVGLSVQDAVLLRPLGYRDEHRLGVVRIDVGDIKNHSFLAQTEIVELQEAGGVFQAVESAIVDSDQVLEVGGEAFTVTGAGVSRGLLQTLGATPALGRLFLEDDPPQGVAILGHACWQSRFRGDPNIIGRGINVFGRTVEVVGVLPSEFRLRLETGVDAPAQVDLWTVVPPERANPGSGFAWGWNALVRLEDGVSFTQANAYLEGFARHQREAYPQVYGSSSLRYTVTPLRQNLVREVRPALRAALLGVLLLLATAGVNAWSLLILASRKRGRELSIRSAMGAGRGTLVAEALLEELILGVVGIILGWSLAVWGIDAVRGVIPHAVPRWETISFGWGSAAQVAAVTLLGLLLAGALTVARADLSSPWRMLSAAPNEGRGGSARGQAVLVGIQVAAAVALLFGAVQLARSARGLAATDIGFQPRGVLSFEVNLAGPGYTAADKPLENQRYQMIRDRLREVPGVRAVGAVSSPPFRSLETINSFETDLLRGVATSQHQVANFYAVLPGYFASMQIPLLQGRDFTDQENLDGEPVAIIDEMLARTAFPGADPIGRTLQAHVPGGSRTPRLPEARIVGVARHARVIDPTQEVRPQVYLPFGLWRWAPLHLTVRGEGDPSRVIPVARAIVQELGAAYPIPAFHLLSEDLDALTSTLRSVTTLVVVLALFASVLSMIGFFVVASYEVVQQRRAIAIRSALGASPGDLLREQLLGRGAILLAALPAGILFSLAGARVLESLVYGVEVRDAESLAAAAVLGGLIGLLGTYAPARIAARTDPASVLRGE